MKTLRLAAAAGVLFVPMVVALTVVTAQQRSVAQSDGDPLMGRFLGTWKLNLDKSKYDPGPPPKSGLGKHEGAPNGCSSTSSITLTRKDRQLTLRPSESSTARTTRLWAPSLRLPEHTHVSTTGLLKSP